MRNFLITTCIIFTVFVISCSTPKDVNMKFTGAKGEVRLVTLDPGHFHAALVQKKMYDQISSVVQVYAPEGPDVENHLNIINSYNSRSENPTAWEIQKHSSPDYLQNMVNDNAGNVVMIAGNNLKKVEYIKTSIDAGFNVLADKPMCIDKTGFYTIEETFKTAALKNILLYDVMTERYEITTIMQKEISQIPQVFGTLETGSLESPAVTKESVHHFFKYVSGNPVKRPGWFMDTAQQGEGIVDVTTHLVDLVQWECFPEQILDYKTDIELVQAKRWPTLMTLEQFNKITSLTDFPEYLQTKIDDNGNLPVYANGEISYKLKGVYAKVQVIWNFQAPEGAGDTHYSIMRGSKSNVIIRQGKEQNYKPELYIEPAQNIKLEELDADISNMVNALQQKYPGIQIEKITSGWHINIPDNYRDGHEAHFAKVTEKYLQYLVDGKLPEWEVPNMIAKYYTTTSALELALQEK